MYKDTIIFKLDPASQDEVKIQVNCFHGTVISLKSHYSGSKRLHCGDSDIIGIESVLADKSIIIEGGGNNPSSGPFKFELVITAQETKIYTFPDDYEGQPPFDENDQNPYVELLLKF